MNGSFRALVAPFSERCVGERAARCTFPARRAGLPGFSLIEAVVSIVLVGVVFVAALEAVAQTVKSRSMMSERAVAHALAERLMAEILARPYDDPSETDTDFGPTAAELSASGGSGGAAGRTGFDDVRDYDGWTASPPKDRGGTPYTQAAGMREAVKVVYVSFVDLSQAVGSDNGLLKVTVTITGRDDRKLAELTALRSRAASQAEAGE